MLLRWIAPTCWLALAAALAAQTAPKPGAAPVLPDLGAPAALPDGAPPHLELIEREGLRKHAYWLAGDERRGRYTGSSAQQETAEYVAKHFASLGLNPLGDKKGFLQSYPVTKIGLDKTTTLQFGRTKVDRGFAVLHATTKDKVALSGKFAWCGNGAPSSLPASLEKKLPLVVFAKPTSGGGSQGPGNDLQAIRRYVDLANQLANKGAEAGIVCLLDDGGSFANTLNYRGLLPDHAQLRYGKGGQELGLRVPLFVLNGAQSRALLEHVGATLDEAGTEVTPPKDDKATGKLTLTVKEDDKARATNVVAYLPGTSRKGEAIVYSAHHDHIGLRLDGDAFNGADDNASGTSGLLEIAEAFAKGASKPERSIVFLSVSGEELGLWGSHWYSENPTWPVDKIVANINIDMIGRAKAADGAIKMQITPSHEHAKFSTMVQRGVALGAKFGIQFSSGDTYYARSDHYNFAQKGIPVVFFCDGEHPDYHQVSDTADRLDYPSMEAIARTAFWTGWEAANDKDRPKELGKQAGWQ